ncbi:hypothetical protein ACOMHN_007081 [Nucella lapillus]
MTVGSTVDLIRSLRRSSLRMLGQTYPSWITGGFETRSATLTWFCPPVKAVYQGVTTVACYSYLVRAECHVGTSGRRAVLKRTWQAPC